MIIIPDTHGLDFWKDAVSKRQNNEKIIFLGDYLDPHEGKINKAAFEQCFDNLCQILEFKKANEESCILLFGNHELSYLFGWWTTFPHNFGRHFAYQKFLKKEISNFQLMHVEQYDSKPFLFSHAGVHPSWIKKYVKQKHSIEAAIEYLTISPVKKFRRRLNYLTIERGFFPKRWGSCVWLYLDDWVRIQHGKLGLDPYYQIFGHSALSNPIITETFAALDCRKAFRLDEIRGVIIPL